MMIVGTDAHLCFTLTYVNLNLETPNLLFKNTLSVLLKCIYPLILYFTIFLNLETPTLLSTKF